MQALLSPMLCCGGAVGHCKPVQHFSSPRDPPAACCCETAGRRPALQVPCPEFFRSAEDKRTLPKLLADQLKTGHRLHFGYQTDLWPWPKVHCKWHDLYALLKPSWCKCFPSSCISANRLLLAILCMILRLGQETALSVS